MTRPMSTLLFALVSLTIHVAASSVCCVNEAKSISTPVFITNDAALMTLQGDAGSAVFNFGHLTGSLWALTKCPDASSDSWRVNGDVWHIPQSSWFKWHEFGQVTADTNNADINDIVFGARESGCEIQAVYLGDNGENDLAHTKITCDTSFHRGYLCPAEMALSYPVHFNPEYNAIVSDWGFNAASNAGMTDLNFGWNFGSANLYLYTYCPDGDHDSWFVGAGKSIFSADISTDFVWSLYGPVPDGQVSMWPRQPGCMIGGAYLGMDMPNEEYLGCSSSDSGNCAMHAHHFEGPGLLGESMNGIYGACTNSLANAGPCTGKAVYDFGKNRGPFWARTLCTSNTADSWYVNDQVWHIPHTTTWEWTMFNGAIDASSDYITLTTREAGCMINAVYRGYGTPDNFPCTPSATDAGYKLTCPVMTFDPTSVKAFYSQAQSLQMAVIDSVGGSMSSSPCATGFVATSGIAVNSDGGVFVADQGASTLVYIAPNCGARKTIIPFGHPMGVVSGVDILPGFGKLIVSTNNPPVIWYVELDNNMDIVDYQNTGATYSAIAGALSACSDPYGNNGFLYVQGGKELVFFDVITQIKHVIVPESLGVVDIKGVDYSCKGIFFSANDNNEMWRCGYSDCDMNKDATSGNDFNTMPTFDNSSVATCVPPPYACEMICDITTDGSSCQYLMNPSGVATDVEGTVYVTNEGNGQLVMYRDCESNPTVLGSNIFASDIALYEACECSPPSPSPSPSATPSPSTSTPATTSPSPSTAPVASVSPSPSPSVTPTPSKNIFIQTQIFTSHGACNSAGCINDPVRKPYMVRMRMEASVFERISFAQFGLCLAPAQAVFLSGVLYCKRFIDFSDITNYQLSNFKTYIVSPSAAPDYASPYGPALVVANNFPNSDGSVQSECVAAAVDCELNADLGLGGFFKWALNVPNGTPCYSWTGGVDPIWDGEVVCAGEGLPSFNHIYFDQNNVVMPPSALHGEVNCPNDGWILPPP